MSGDFGEDFKPAKGAEVGKEAQHDPFADERAFKAPETAKPDEKTEVKAAPDHVAATGDKAVFQEGTGKSYSDWLAENRTPQENAAALEKSLMAAIQKMSILAGAGIGGAEHIVGGTFLAGLVKDGSAQEVTNFMDTIKKYIEKK